MRRFVTVPFDLIRSGIRFLMWISNAHSIPTLSNISKRFISTISFDSIQFLYPISCLFFINKKKLAHFSCHCIVGKVHHSFYECCNLTLNYFRLSMRYSIEFQSRKHLPNWNWIPTGLDHHMLSCAVTFVVFGRVESIYKWNSYRIYTKIIKKSSTCN